MSGTQKTRNDWDAPITRTTPKKWGDHTGSPGLVPLKPEERLVRISAYVTAQDRDRLLALGDGNMSHGVRIAINSTWLEDNEQ